MPIPSFIKDPTNIALLAGTIGGVGLGAASGFRSGAREADDYGLEGMSRFKASAGNATAGAMVGSVVGLGISTGLLLAGSKTTANLGASAIQHAARRTEQYFKNLHSEFLAARTTAGTPAAIAKAYGKLPVLAGAGALLGAAIGSRVSPDNPGRGAAYGAAIGGIAVPTAVQAVKGYQAVAKMPGGKIAAATLIAGTIFAGTMAAMPHQNEFEVYGAMSADGGIDYQPEPIPRQTGVKKRLDAMKADGSMVFGMNNLRRG